jgi:hypothetical protein
MSGSFPRAVFRFKRIVQDYRLDRISNHATGDRVDADIIAFPLPYFSVEVRINSLG